MGTENKFINQTTIFAAVSAYIYFVWFQFENGFYSEYKIPNYYITPSISGLLVVAASITSILLASFKTLGLAAPFFKQLKNPKRGYLHGIYFINGLMIVIGILMLHTYPFSWMGILLFFITAIVINLLIWGLAFLFKLKDKKSFEQKIIESITESRDENFDMLNLLDLKFNRNQWLLIITLLVLPAVSYLLGGGTAAGQKSYQCLSNEKNLAVLKKSEDLLICRKFDLTTKTFFDTLYVIKMSDNNEYRFWEQKGILKMR
ncbi:hypothetical protein ABDK00_010920 [Niabella insulamsoli]|uniref:hypothetical protein n=1 Tax=Niabella insulamsoli TaxID=3144874 RepID=UPI0031FE22B2